MIKQQIENIQYFLFCNKILDKYIANHPNINEIKIPIIDDEKLEISKLISDAPIIKGIAIKNENLIASSLLTPNSNNVDIVIPDLEIPGNSAKICNMPTIIASFKVIFFEPELNFVKNKIIAVNKKE